MPTQTPSASRRCRRRPAEIDRLAVVGGDRAAEIFEAVGGRRRVRHQRLLDRLAGVERLDAGELGVAGAQDVGGAAQDAAALDRLQPRPGRLRGRAASTASSSTFGVAERSMAMVSPVAG